MNKRTIEGENGLSTIHFKNWNLEKSSVSKRGFQLETRSAPRIRQ
jgi:hypothetical protein